MEARTTGFCGRRVVEFFIVLACSDTKTFHSVLEKLGIFSSGLDVEKETCA